MCGFLKKQKEKKMILLTYKSTCLRNPNQGSETNVWRSHRQVNMWFSRYRLFDLDILHCIDFRSSNECFENET